MKTEESKLEAQQDITTGISNCSCILVEMLKEVYKRTNADGSAEIYNAEFIGTNVQLPIEGEERVINDVLKKYCA